MTAAQQDLSAFIPSAESRVQVRLCRPAEEVCETVPPDQIDRFLGERGVILWVDVQDPAPEDLEMLREEFGFHRLALEDAAHQNQRAKVDEYPDFYFVVMHAPVPGPPESVTMRELDLFVGRNFVVSAHRGEIPSLQEALSRWRRTDPALRSQIGFLLHTIIDSVIDSYFPLVDGIEDRLDELELSLFSGGRGAADNPEDLLAIKRDLFTLRKAIYPLRDVFNSFLRRDSQIFTAETYPYFQDVYDHVLRLLDTVDIQRDMATGSLDAHLAVISNRLNETMKRLTVVAICVAVMGAVFGAWGMNFTHVPLDHLGVAGFVILTLTALGLALLSVLIARWKGLW